MSLAGRFREQARACERLGSAMYGELLDRIAHDIEAGGVSRDVLAGHENDPGPSALALRLAGSAHRLVLERRAGALATYYPSVGGRWDLAGAWPAFESLLASEPDAVRKWLDRPPQTNEIGRSTALMGGLLRMRETVSLPVRLFEIGSSGGLNLHADRFRFQHEDGFAQGPFDSPVRLEEAWRGGALQPWPDLRVVERVGSDLMPVDVCTTSGRLLLTAYVWPDQAARLERLRAGFEVAAQFPAEVRRTDAVSFVDDIELVAGTTTVLWHSVMWQYLTRDDQQALTERIEVLGASAGPEMRFAHLSLEPTRRASDTDYEFLVTLRLWPDGEQRILGASVAHGVPTTWE
ncbi:MAG: DUF2332 domain-containing protein [Actinomycetota bacterium]|nr:DUF2332 domain-containing protein [Actinomycetota bacterium]